MRDQRLAQLVEPHHVAVAVTLRVERRALLEERETGQLRRSTIRIPDVKANEVRPAAGLGLDTRCELCEDANSNERRRARQPWQALTHGFIVVCFVRCISEALGAPRKWPL